MAVNARTEEFQHIENIHFADSLLALSYRIANR